MRLPHPLARVRDALADSPRAARVALARAVYSRAKVRLPLPLADYASCSLPKLTLFLLYRPSSSTTRSRPSTRTRRAISSASACADPSSSTAPSCVLLSLLRPFRISSSSDSLSRRPQLLITHHISLCLTSADYVVRLSEGRVTLQGKVDELDKNELTTELIEDDDAADDAERADDEAQKLDKSGKVDSKDPHEAEHAAALAALGPSSSVGTTPGTSTPIPGSESAAASKRTGKLIVEEKRATGRVKLSVYNLYLRSAGYYTWAFMVALLFVGRAGRVADRAFFRWWGESVRPSSTALLSRFIETLAHAVAVARSTASPTLFSCACSCRPRARSPCPPSTLRPTRSRTCRLRRRRATTSRSGSSATPSSVRRPLSPPFIPYSRGSRRCRRTGLLNLAITVIGILAAFHGSFKAARSLFKSSLIRVIYAPFRYFDTTPSGRILNRYATDFPIIDGSLTDQVRITLTHAFRCVLVPSQAFRRCTC